MSDNPDSQLHRLVGVFRDEAAAREAVNAVRREGLALTSVRLGAGTDSVASLRGEMREELDHTVIGPGNIGPFTKEMTKGLGKGALGGAVIGMILALPLALINVPGVPLLFRLLIAAIVGAVGGATLGFVLGGGLKPDLPRLAAERGVVVSIESQDPSEVERASKTLSRMDPVRLDAFGPGGQPLGVVTTEEESSDEGS